MHFMPLRSVWKGSYPIILNIKNVCSAKSFFPSKFQNFNFEKVVFGNYHVLTSTKGRAQLSRTLRNTRSVQELISNKNVQNRWVKLKSMASLYLFTTELMSYGLLNLPREHTEQSSNKMALIHMRSIACREDAKFCSQSSLLSTCRDYAKIHKFEVLNCCSGSQYYMCSFRPLDVYLLTVLLIS